MERPRIVVPAVVVGLGLGVFGGVLMSHAESPDQWSARQMATAEACADALPDVVTDPAAAFPDTCLPGDQPTDRPYAVLFEYTRHGDSSRFDANNVHETETLTPKLISANDFRGRLVNIYGPGSADYQERQTEYYAWIASVSLAMLGLGFYATINAGRAIQEHHETKIKGEQNYYEDLKQGGVGELISDSV